MSNTARLNKSFSPIRIGTIVYDRNLNPCALTDFSVREECPQPGLIAEILEKVLYYLDAPYELIPYNNTHRGFQAIYADMISGKLDFSASGWIYTPSRLKALDPSFPFSWQQPAYVVRRLRPDYFVSSMGTFTVFSNKVWLSILCCIVLFFAVLYLSVLAFSEHDSKLFVWNNFQQRTLKFTLTIALFSYIFFSTLYQNTLLAKLMNPPEVRLFDNVYDMIDLVKQGRLSIISVGDLYWHTVELKTSDHRYYKLLREATIQNPLFEVQKNEWEIQKLIATGKYILPTTLIGAHDYLSKLGSDSCKFDIIEGSDLPEMRNGFLFPKNSTWLKAFDEQLIALQGFTELTWSKYRRKHECNDYPMKGRPKMLDLMAVSGGLNLWGVGLVLSSVYLITEIVCSRTQKKYMGKFSLEDERKRWEHLEEIFGAFAKEHGCETVKLEQGILIPKQDGAFL